MDIYGRYTLAEMRDAVRRKLDEIRANSVDIETGEESDEKTYGQLITNPTIDLHIRTALTVYFIDMVASDERFFTDETYIDIKEDIDEYQLPEDLGFLRALYWKPEGVTATQIPMNKRKLMPEIDLDNDIGGELEDDAPRYRITAGGFRLDRTPQRDNDLGVLVSYVKLPHQMLKEEHTLDIHLPIILQEVMILDTVVEITAQILKIDTQELRLSLQRLVERLTLAVRMNKLPKTVQLKPTQSLVEARHQRNRRYPTWR